MSTDLVKLTLNYDKGHETGEYYIGKIKKQTDKYLIFEAIDDDANLGGISVFKNGTYQIETAAPEIDYYKYLDITNAITDIFHIKALNKQILTWQWSNLSELLKIIYDKRIIINIELKSGDFYSGGLEVVTSDYVFLKEKTDSCDLEECPTVIYLDDISTVAIDEYPNTLFIDWYDHQDEFDKDYNLVEIYLAYQDDKLFKEWPVIGKIIKEDENHILFHRLNVIGQIDAVTVINKKRIAHMSDTAVDLPYYNFLMHSNKAKGIFDPHYLLDKDYDMNYELNKNALVTLDDANYGRITGIIKDKKKDSLFLQEIDHYVIQKEIELRYSNILSVDLNSNDLLNLGRYRDFL